MSDSGELGSIFNTHVEMIDASSAAVWDMFHDRSQWMDSFISRTLISGVNGQTGAVSQVLMKVPSSPVRFEELLYVSQFRREVVRISAPDAGALAHADFEFDQLGSQCRLQVSIHTFLGTQTRLSLDKLRQATDEKIRSDFARLRETVESAAR